MPYDNMEGVITLIRTNDVSVKIDDAVIKRPYDRIKPVVQVEGGGSYSYPF